MYILVILYNIWFMQHFIFLTLLFENWSKVLNIELNICLFVYIFHILKTLEYGIYTGFQNNKNSISRQSIIFCVHILFFFYSVSSVCTLFVFYFIQSSIVIAQLFFNTHLSLLDNHDHCGFAVVCCSVLKLLVKCIFVKLKSKYFGKLKHSMK